MDVWYAINRNFWLDLKIIFDRACMIRRDGA
jgi:lipopolysaccharide/colanic/teichoic acid biosynthesis glycosyltransferase